ncbi:MAG TPA: endonuclease/exonuclease/phosphatase family protein [Gemmataceae bacterium]|nr:endonuclease/exonuclease/phosphatase family protein [Gemmataceae bacterium]
MIGRSVRILLVVLVGAFATLLPAGCKSRQENQAGSGSQTYLFCFWNVENLFDDHLDGRENRADKEFDTWFAHDAHALRLKLDHLSEALIRLNNGKGPDILAVVEVESRRAAELLQEALNSRLPDPSLHYQHLLMKELAAGRHIAPAILTRLPVVGDRTRLHGSRLRILEGHIDVHGHDLVVIASHWTARVTDEHGEHRDKYGDQIHGIFRAMYASNPQVDFLVCGDFNDPPDAPSVTEHLRAIGDLKAVLQPRGDPLLLDLLADKSAEAGWGTHFYAGRWEIFDQFAISPGLLDHVGWSCDPESVQTVNTLVQPTDKKRRPWRFGNEHDKHPRGASDHFPVTVQLRVQGSP